MHNSTPAHSSHKGRKDITHHPGPNL
jgi:hypothetical protein